MVFKVLVVCTGNICRSPVAHAVLDNLVAANNVLRNKVIIDSCGTHNFHVGSIPDYRSIKVSKDNGLNIEYIKARLLQPKDHTFDLILGMDKGHVATLKMQFPDSQNKIFLFEEYVGNKNIDIEDPYYGNYEGFVKMYSQINIAAHKLILKLENELI
jgi:protein-tyrosine phosphatase